MGLGAGAGAGQGGRWYQQRLGRVRTNKEARDGGLRPWQESSLQTATPQAIPPAYLKLGTPGALPHPHLPVPSKHRAGLGGAGRMGLTGVPAPQPRSVTASGPAPTPTPGSPPPPPSYRSRISPGSLGHLPRPGKGAPTVVGEAPTGLRYPANRVPSEAVSRARGVTLKPDPSVGLSPLLSGPEYVPRSAAGTPAVTPGTPTHAGVRVQGSAPQRTSASVP